VKRLALALTIVVAMLATAGSAGEILDGVAAIVNDKVITYSEVRDLVAPVARQLSRSYSGSNLVAKIQAANVDALNNLIERELIIQEFKGKGYSIPETVIDEEFNDVVARDYGGDRTAFIKTLQAEHLTVAQYRDQLRDRIIVQAMRNSKTQKEVIVSPYKIDKYYQEHQDDYKVDEQIKLRMIFIKASLHPATPVSASAPTIATTTTQVAQAQSTGTVAQVGTTTEVARASSTGQVAQALMASTNESAAGTATTQVAQAQLTDTVAQVGSTTEVTQASSTNQAAQSWAATTNETVATLATNQVTSMPSTNQVAESVDTNQVAKSAIATPAPVAPPQPVDPRRKLGEEIVAKLDAGASFESLAKLYSEGKEAKEGGDWGWIGKDVLRKELNEVAFALKPGQHSRLIETQEGYYILEVDDVKSAHTKPLAEVRDEIEKILLQQQRQKMQESWVKDLRAKAYIRYF